MVTHRGIEREEREDMEKTLSMIEELVKELKVEDAAY